MTTTTPPSWLLVFLHGHDDAPDPYLAQLPALLPPGFSAVVPRGPLQGEGDTAGWFDRIDGEPNPVEVGTALEAITAIVDHESARTGIPVDHIVLGGFSQGAAMALAWALRDDPPAPPIAGLMIISGWLPDVDGLSFDLGRAVGLPIFVGHGDDDEVVPPPLGGSVARALTRQGALVTFFRHDGAHDAGPAISEARDWLTTFTVTED
jgi:phospholipase/carboxylesterase